MSSTRRPISELLIGLGSKTKLATNILFAGALAVIACCLFSLPSEAQGPLSIGTIQVSNTPVTCDPHAGWYSYTNGANTYDLICATATISNCSNTQPLGLTFGYLNPLGIVPNITQTLGTIVLFNGGAGTTPGNFAFAGSYFTAGYEVVELAWGDDWEQTYDPFPVTTPPTYGNIQNAACRPATFLSYVNTNIFPAVLSQDSKAGFCAHGESAGSGQIVYSLAYYGAGSWLDNVELISGPVFGDISQGCQVPGANPVTVCGKTDYHGGQYGCQLGGGSTWALNPAYIQDTETKVGQWTNDPLCANTFPIVTTGTQNANWLAQSIVDLSTGGVPTFNYPSTAMSGWLCRSVLNNGNTPYPCAANNNNNGNFCPNNSSPQAQIFYANIGQNNSPPNYAVYAVDNCVHAEGVEMGNVPGFDPAYFQGTVTGSNAVTYDMIGYAPAQLAAQCVRRIHQ